MSVDQIRWASYACSCKSLLFARSDHARNTRRAMKTIHLETSFQFAFQSCFFNNLCWTDLLFSFATHCNHSVASLPKRLPPCMGLNSSPSWRRTKSPVGMSCINIMSTSIQHIDIKSLYTLTDRPTSNECVPAFVIAMGNEGRAIFFNKG